MIVPTEIPAINRVKIMESLGNGPGHIIGIFRRIIVIIAGPTFDSIDIMYEDAKYKLPISLKAGDKLYWLSTGAYTSTYASVAFNGFPPIKTYFMK